MTDVIDKPNLKPDQQAMLSTWQQHAHAEFVLKDADAALATMTKNPYVFLVASGVGRIGRAAVHEFYANKFLPKIPPDLELTSLSQTFGADRIVEEMVMRFTHTIEMDWILPGVRHTHRSVEFALAGIIRFEAGK
jgi:carboxymethylenebutenolidase